LDKAVYDPDCPLCSLFCVTTLLQQTCGAGFQTLCQSHISALDGRMFNFLLRGKEVGVSEAIRHSLDFSLNLFDLY